MFTKMKLPSRSICSRLFYSSLITGKPSQVFLENKCAFHRIGSVQFMSMQKQFEEAKSRLNSLPEAPGNDIKLQLYGLFKQATEGPVKSKRPGMTDFVGRAKWDAWSSHGDIGLDEARQKYVDLVNSLVKSEESQNAATQESGQKYKYILVECDGSLRKITLNRPKKMNALLYDMYSEIVDALEEADKDPRTILTVFTGAGSYFCSGNDLQNFANVTPDTKKQAAEEAYRVLVKYVAAFIDFSKPLVAVVNGPAIGISVTVLSLFDAVYCTDKATFHTPFAALGQSPEGCSSLTFPRMMGFAKSSDILLFGKKISAAEALSVGLVSEVYPDNVFQSEIWPKLLKLSKLPPQSLKYSKQLIRGFDKETLHKVNEMECERLKERWQSDECENAIIAFMTRKNTA